MLSLAGFEARVLYRALVRAVDAYLGEVARGAQVLLPREEARLLLADDAAAAAATATATTAGASALSPWTPLDTSAARSFTWLHAVAVFDVGGAAGSMHAADGAASPSVRLADVRKEAVGVLKRRFTSAPTEHEAQRKALSGGYQMLRSLKGRAKALRAMSYVPHSDAVTAGVRVVVAARYLPPHALPPQMPRTAPSFAYDITIINTSSRNVQLLRRQWEILDLDGSVVEVEGAGVVGETPHLAARTGWHRYSSWTRSSSYGGTMRGSFLMVDADAPHPDSTAFHVTVAPFGLVVPNEWCLRPPPPQQ